MTKQKRKAAEPQQLQAQVPQKQPQKPQRYPRRYRRPHSRTGRTAQTRYLQKARKALRRHSDDNALTKQEAAFVLHVRAMVNYRSWRRRERKAAARRRHHYALRLDRRVMKMLKTWTPRRAS